MPAPTICTVSGVLRDTQGTFVSGATIKANINKPFIHPTDSSLIINYEVTTLSDGLGAWSLNIVETTTPLVSVTITFYYPAGTATGNDRKEYTITVPNSASATFASLIGSQL